MKRRILWLALLGCTLAAPLTAVARSAPGSSHAADASGRPRVLVVHFTAEVNPITQDWLDGQLDRAVRDHFSAVVIELDTPGGLEESMRKIVQKELAVSRAGVPVIVYVGPGGARAASAGVWISEAADVLAMAPETNIGSSTPINGSGSNIGSDLRRKVINDAAASLRGLARSHGRNAHWADQAVRVARNLTAEEALRQHVIDLVSPGLPQLLDTIDGRTTVPARLTLHTRDAQLVDARPGFLTRFLSTILDPNLLSLLFLAGLLGLGFELFHPGAVIPGAVGGVSMLLALFGMSVLPLSWAGLGLVLLGTGLLVADAHVTSHGALTFAGLLALGFGLATLFHDEGPYRTSVPLMVAVAVALGGLWALALGKAVSVRRNPVGMDPEEIVGLEGVVRDGGLVFVHGELWRALAESPLAPGQRVRVDALEGLTLRVHRVGV